MNDSCTCRINYLLLCFFSLFFFFLVIIIIFLEMHNFKIFHKKHSLLHFCKLFRIARCVTNNSELYLLLLYTISNKKSIVIKKINFQFSTDLYISEVTDPQKKKNIFIQNAYLSSRVIPLYHQKMHDIELLVIVYVSAVASKAPFNLEKFPTEDDDIIAISTPF